MTCDQRRDLLLLYVSDALEAAEAAELRRHLQSGCPACAGHLAEAQALTASLPLGLDPVLPAANLKSRLMAKIDAAENAQLSIAAGSQTTISKVIDANRMDSDSFPMRLFRILVPAAVAAGIAVVITHAIMNQRVNVLQQQAISLRQQNQFAAMEALSSRQQIDLLGATAKSQAQVVDMLRSPDVRLIRLKPTDQQPGAVANLLWDMKKQTWAVLTDGMSPAKAGETYELWFIPEAGSPVAAGTFDVDATGRGSLHAAVPPNLGPLKLAAVTNEKIGGALAPLGQAQVAGSVE